MLQFNDDGAAGWDHRAYWGEDLIPAGASGTTGRARIGDLPKAGEWVRLEVPIEAVGLVLARPHGVAITQFDGTSHWDQLGVQTTATKRRSTSLGSTTRPRKAPASGVMVARGAGSRAASGARRRRARGSGAAPQRPRAQPGLLQRRRAPLRLQDGDKLFAHGLFDPSDPPQSVQLQFYSRTWDHRVRWGVAAHGAGRANGADHRAGDLPSAGEWVRLEVDIADVGLAVGDVVDGWAFTQVGGTVYWDEAGVRQGPPDDRPLYSMLAWSSSRAGRRDAQGCA